MCLHTQFPCLSGRYGAHSYSVYIYLAGGGFGDLTLAVLSIVEVCQVNVIKCCQEIRYVGGESVARQN